MTKRNKKVKIRLFLLLVVFSGTIFLLLLDIFYKPNLNVIILPQPDLIGSLPLSSAIHQSQVDRNLTTSDTSIKDLAQLLWSFQGITHGPGFRSAPSAGATYPLEIYLWQKTTIPSLKEGLYEYNPFQHQLELLSVSINESLLLSALSDDDGKVITVVNTIFFILADYYRTTSKYGERGVQYVHLEVGHTIQNFFLQLTALTLTTYPITEFSPFEIQQFLMTPLDPQIILPIGKKSIQETPIPHKKEVKLLNSDTQEMTVEEAIARRKSTREYQSGEVPSSIILDILVDSTIISYFDKNRFNFEFHLVAGEVEGVSSGLYHYTTENQSLKPLNNSDLRSPLKQAALGQSWVENAQLDLVLSINTTWISQQNDSLYAKRLIRYNIGMIAQNIYLKCTSYYLGTVVIGAFYEKEVAKLLDLSPDYTPIYIIPIGLTPEFFEEHTTYQPSLIELARFCGLLSFILFYCCLYLTIPTSSLVKRSQLILHYLTGLLLIGTIGLHYIILHGQMETIWDLLKIGSYLNAIDYFINDIISFPPTTREELGKMAANLAVITIIITIISGIVLIIKKSNSQIFFKRIHITTFFIVLLLTMVHVLFNGIFFSNKPQIFLYLNILAISFYFLLKQYISHCKQVVKTVS